MRVKSSFRYGLRMQREGVQGPFGKLVLIPGLDFKVIKKTYFPIVENFDFLSFFGLQKVEICRFSTKFLNLTAKNQPKNLYFQNGQITFFTVPKSIPDIKTSIPNALSLQIFGLLGDFWGKKRSFPYENVDFLLVVPSRHRSPNNNR